jgi:glutathione synthase/RimK-type ligase-like ATP-grasp enzyme
MKTVGLLVGRERSFPDALIAAINARDEGVTASYASLDITPVSEPAFYDVLIDRISHDVPCYQPMLKCAALAGSYVINNPFWRIADDKAFGTALAARLGVPVPKTYVLPSKLYSEDVSAESLHNLRFPLDWGRLPREAGFPMYIKPHWGGGFRDVYRVDDMTALFRAYDRSGQKTMIVQEGIEWQQYVRCVVIGKTRVLPLLWDPRLPHHQRYASAARTMPALDPALEERVVAHARTLCDALGYDMNTCEFAIRDGVPYAIDFMNSAPDFDISSLGEGPFRWVVDEMAALCTSVAHAPPRVGYRWSEMLAGAR